MKNEKRKVKELLINHPNKAIFDKFLAKDHIKAVLELHRAEGRNSTNDSIKTSVNDYLERLHELAGLRAKGMIIPKWNIAPKVLKTSKFEKYLAYIIYWLTYPFTKIQLPK